MTTHTKLIQKAAPCVLVLATIWATIAAIALFDIQPSRGFSIAEMFPPGHNGRLADELRRDLRSTQSKTTDTLNIVWGIKEVDDFKPLEADKDNGEPYWGPPTYKPLIEWKEAEQAFFAKACTMLFERTDLVAHAGEHTCAVLRVQRRWRRAAGQAERSC